MYNKSGIWGSRPKIMEIRLVFAPNLRFFVKPLAHTYGFRAKIKKKNNPVKTHIRDRYI
jgi:hypothetical protein